MHPLLVPADLDVPTATRRCSAHLRARHGAWLVLLRTLGEPERSDLTALFAWDAVARETADERADFDAERGFAELRRELDAIEEGATGSAVGRALAQALRRHDLDVTPLAQQLDVLARGRTVASFPSRTELVAYARTVAAPLGRLAPAIVGLTGERRATQGESLALGLELARFTSAVAHDAPRGRIRIALDDPGSLPALGEGRADEGVRRSVGAQIALARAELAKGWPLIAELGPLRARAAAFALRWHAAALTALEARDCDPFPAPPPAGFARLVACGVAALAGPGAPRLV